MRFEWQHTTPAVQIKEGPLDNLVKALMIVNNFVIDAQLVSGKFHLSVYGQFQWPL